VVRCTRQYYLGTECVLLCDLSADCLLSACFSSFEPYTSNIYVRRTLAGEFVCVSRHLLEDLIELGIWSPELKNKIIANNGSIQAIEEIPAAIKELYKTVWSVRHAYLSHTSHSLARLNSCRHSTPDSLLPCVPVVLFLISHRQGDFSAHDHRHGRRSRCVHRSGQ
jgi:ribonucleotide reductase alpha subunit